MLIYIESKLFQYKTFTIVCNSYDTIARARAYLLHILYELGKEQHQFRLRFKGEYLRDCHTFNDYGILDNSVIKMVPMAKINKSVFSLGSKTSFNYNKDHLLIPGPKPDLLKEGHLHEIQNAVQKEVKIFKRRETLLGLFKAILWIHFLATFLAFSSLYWYSGFWTGLLMIYGLYYCPIYSKMSGFVGRNNISNKQFLVFFGIGSILHCVSSTVMGALLLLEVQSYACGDAESLCNHQKEVLTWSVVFYFGHGAFLLASFILVLLLARNFQYEVGDIIVDNLVQSRDLDKVLRSAKLGGVKERRNAAFEMVSLVASNSETKMTIIEVGGLEVLINLALSTDSATQEYATEAIAELLTESSIQEKFVEAGGIRTLCALLRSSEIRVVTEAVTAMSYIVAHNETNRLSFVSENGLNDLAHVSTKVPVPVSRIVAGMFLELAFTSEVRSIMAAQSSPVNALLSLAKTNDYETVRLSLQTLELLAIAEPAVIHDNTSLLSYLLSLQNFEDEHLYILAGKLLLYYASNEQACDKLVKSEKLKESLLRFSVTTNVALQTVIAKIILAILDTHEDKDEVLELDLMEVLLNIHDTTDHDAWELVDQAMTIIKDIAPYSKKSSASSTVQSDDGSGPSNAQNDDKDKTEVYQRKKNNTIHFVEP